MKISKKGEYYTLKAFTEGLCGRTIQNESCHSAKEDALAVIEIYKIVDKEKVVDIK